MVELHRPAWRGEGCGSTWLEFCDWSEGNGSPCWPCGRLRNGDLHARPDGYLGVAVHGGRGTWEEVYRHYDPLWSCDVGLVARRVA